MYAKNYEKKPHPICRRSIDKWLLHTLKTIPLWYSPTLTLAIGQCENAEVLIDWLSVAFCNVSLGNRLFQALKLSRVCHLSAFQTKSVRSVYIKIINYSGIIHVLANLNNTLQTKQHATKKITLIFSYKQDMLGSIFCGGRIFVQTLQFLFIQ